MWIFCQPYNLNELNTQHSEKQHGITRQCYLQLNTTDNDKTTRILKKLQHKYTCLPERPYTALYSWWWVELSPETCRVKPLRRINTTVASCWIYFTISVTQHMTQEMWTLIYTLLYNAVFWDVTSCNLVECSRRIQCLHHHKWTEEHGLNLECSSQELDNFNNQFCNPSYMKLLWLLHSSLRQFFIVPHTIMKFIDLIMYSPTSCMNQF